jgi:hypothetical protein
LSIRIHGNLVLSTPKLEDMVWIDHAVKHKMRKSGFGIVFSFEKAQGAEDDLTNDIEVFLGSLFGSPAKIFPKMHIQKPMHRFKRPL